MIQEILANTLTSAQWKRVGIKHHHGINLPLSALHSEKSCGIGEFFDLIPLIDWCQKMGMDVIQLLPLNDSGDNPSPYYSTSALALHPIFLSLHKLPHLDHDLQKKIEELRRFNASPRLLYDEVLAHKFFFLRNYYDKVGKTITTSTEFALYVQENPWVEWYALFKVLKEEMSKTSWLTWPDELKNLTEKTFQKLKHKYIQEMNFYIFVQYLCFTQLKEIHTYAHHKKVLLGGDIPILISPDSADVWQHTDEFDLSLGAGSPPDVYAEEGQVWGLPLYNWEQIKKHHFSWWKSRLKYSSEFYDLYRLDHVIGFFRIWAIPSGEKPRMGKFIPHDKTTWIEHGKKILTTLVESSFMLPIAEDLGDVLDSMRAALTEMGICRTIVMRWERRWKQDQGFIDIQDYNPISMTTLSTHDSDTLTQWWQNFPKEAKLYAIHKGWHYHPHLERAHRKQILWESHHSASLFHINLIGEYLALFPELVWEDPNDERINIPGKILPTNWIYRIRPSLEELLAHEGLTKEIRNIITASDPYSLLHS